MLTVFWEYISPPNKNELSPFTILNDIVFIYFQGWQQNVLQSLQWSMKIEYTRLLRYKKFTWPLEKQPIMQTPAQAVMGDLVLIIIFGMI